MKAGTAIVIAALPFGVAVAGCGTSAHHARTYPTTAPYTVAPHVNDAATPASSASTGPAAAAITRKVTHVVFRVRGTGLADITDGTDTTNLSPDNGNGTEPPFTASMRYHSSAEYYDVSAQLQGSGDIRCAVLIRLTVYYGDGTHISRSKVAARGHASGGYNICDAQVSN